MGEEYDGVYLNSAPLPHCVDAFVGLALDVYAFDLDAEDPSEVGTHGRDVLGDLGAFEDDGGIEIDDGEARRGAATGGLGEEDL